MSNGFEHANETPTFQPGWTVYPPETLAGGKVKFDLMLRTATGVARAYLYTTVDALKAGNVILEGSVIEPGTLQGDGSGKALAVKLAIQDAATLHLSVKGGPYILKRGEGRKVYFAYLDKRPERGEATDLADLLG